MLLAAPTLLTVALACAVASPALALTCQDAPLRSYKFCDRTAPVSERVGARRAAVSYVIEIVNVIRVFSLSFLDFTDYTYSVYPDLIARSPRPRV